MGSMHCNTESPGDVAGLISWGDTPQIYYSHQVHPHESACVSAADSVGYQEQAFYCNQFAAYGKTGERSALIDSAAGVEEDVTDTGVMDPLLIDVAVSWSS